MERGLEHGVRILGRVEVVCPTRAECAVRQKGCYMYWKNKAVDRIDRVG